MINFEISQHFLVDLYSMVHNFELPFVVEVADRVAVDRVVVVVDRGVVVGRVAGVVDVSVVGQGVVGLDMMAG